ncbi:MAG: ABC transporter substrate-binding protein [Vulcanimicrobiaceae bacterium]
MSASGMNPKKCMGALCALVAVLLSGAQPRAAAQRHPYTIAHELRYATAEDITGLNPHLASQATVHYLSSLTMAWLTKTGPHNEAIPELALVVPTQANGGVSKDGRTITWHLRRDAKWSDGVPFTADDVVFSTAAVLNPRNNETGRSGWDLITKVDEPDKYTVIYHLKHALAGFEYGFFSTAGANPCILPKHILGKLSEINDAPYNALPVGIGPFKYVSWRRSDSVEMVADQLYFGKRPKLQKIVFKIIPDRNTVLTQLRTHELDMWLPVTAHYYPQIKAIRGIMIVQRPGYVFDHLDFNIAHPIVADSRVRRALRLAIDRKDLLAKIQNDLGSVQDSPVGPANPAHDPHLGTTPFDLAAARKLLDDAGWKPGSGGIRANGGRRLVLDFATSVGTPDSDTRIELIRGWWKQIGVDFVVKHYPSPLLFGAFADGGIINTGKFDVVGFAWGGDPIGDLSNLYECDQIPPAGQNDVHYCNRAVDAAMERFKLTLSAAARQPLTNFVQAAIVRDAPTIVLDTRDDIFAFNSDLTGFQPNQLSPFDELANADI